MTGRKPRTVNECPQAPTPCPWVTCKYHLWTYRVVRGGYSSVRRAVGWGDAGHTCALRVANDGEHTREEVAAILHISRARVQDVEAMALSNMRRLLSGPVPAVVNPTTQPRVTPKVTAKAPATTCSPLTPTAVCPVCRGSMATRNKAGQPRVTCGRPGCAQTWARRSLKGNDYV